MCTSSQFCCALASSVSGRLLSEAREPSVPDTAFRGPVQGSSLHVLTCWTLSFLGAHFPAPRVSTITIPFPDRMTSVFFSLGGDCRAQRSGQLTLQNPFFTFPWTTCGPYTCILLDHLPPLHLHSPGPPAAFTPHSPGPPAAVLSPGNLGGTLARPAPDPVLWALGLDLNGKHWSSCGRALIQPGWPSLPPRYLLAVLRDDVGSMPCHLEALRQ